MPTPRRDNDWRAIATNLRADIESIRTPSGSTPAAASRALRQLDKLEAAIENRLTEERDARRRRVVGPRAAERPTIYSIEPSPRGDALTEKREGVARPMKVPKEIYRAVAEILATLHEPSRFEPIHSAVERRIGSRVAPYAVRVPLRFWAVAGLLSHEQARFAPALPAKRFLTEARRAWRQVGTQPVRVEPTP